MYRERERNLLRKVYSPASTSEVQVEKKKKDTENPGAIRGPGEQWARSHCLNKKSPLPRQKDFPVRLEKIK